jgi:peptide/nickel transport system substrate-binding protein
MKRIVFLVFLILFVTGCDQKVERNPNTFVESSIGDARRLNPVIANDSASGTINDQVFNGLVKYDKDIRLVGDLAERWDVTNGGKTITFHLRKGVKWHDGVEFTAEDCLRTRNSLIRTWPLPTAVPTWTYRKRRLWTNTPSG